jgi:myo-inositol-1-phosphate synthase
MGEGDFPRRLRPLTGVSATSACVSMPTIRVAIVGVGNCASSFVQGLSYYSNGHGNEPMTGIMNAAVGGYEIKDVRLSAAFDVHAGKVGRDVAEAIFVKPNNTYRFAAVAETGVVVQRGATHDGLGAQLRDQIPESDLPPVDVADVLKSTGTDVVVSYLPVGSERASEYYAEQAITAGCAYVNCIPVFLASNPKWRRRFEERRVPIIGDDVKSQVGATIVHRVLANLFRERGVRLDRTYQLNFGGNTDFLNMLDRDRLQSKKISKTQSVNSQLDQPLPADRIHIGPSDFVPWLDDRKFAYIRLEGTAFGGVPLNLEVKLEVWDSPNSAGVVIDAVRCAKLALDRRIGGALLGPSSYFMKSPPQQFTDSEAREQTLRFIQGE